MMEAWFLICAALLVVSGGAKLANPEPTSGALAAVSLPSRRLFAQAIGGAEIAAGAVGLAFGDVAGGLGVAVVYLGFAGFVTIALVRHLPLQSCGCFGRTDTPPTWGHIVVNGAAVVSGVWVAIRGFGGLPAALDGRPAAGLPYLLVIALGVGALYLALTRLVRFTGPRHTRSAPASFTTGLDRVPTTTLDGHTANGEPISIPVVGASGQALVIFLTTGCMSCRTFWIEQPVDLPSPLGTSDTIVVAKGAGEEDPVTVETVNVHGLTVVMSTEVWNAFAIPVAPYFMVIDRTDGAIVAQGAAATWGQVVETVESVRRDPSQRPHRTGTEPPRDAR